MAACDASDGLKDGLVSNPTTCHVDPQALVCGAGDTKDCLTPAQVATVRGLWAPISTTPSQNEFPSPLLLPGAELGWATLAGSEPIRNAADVLRYIVFQDPSWNWRTFNAKTDLSRAADATRSVDATDPDLRPFFSRGGKLLMYHGWADPQVSPYTSINYFSDVAKIAGADSVGRAVQLYMAPGMNHCRGGEGPDTFDFVAAMESWVRTGAAPAQVIGAHRTAGAVDRTRPVCAYPQVAMYRGSGSIDDAANFSCAAAPSK